MAKAPQVDKDQCIICGLCISHVPAVFRLDDDGIVRCYNPAGASEEEIQKYAVRMCPVQCIRWQG